MTLIRPRRQLFNIFLEQVDRQPDAPYLTYEEITYTYQHVSDLVRSVAGQLSDRLAPGSMIALNYEDPVKFILAFWACVQLDISFLLLPSVPGNTLDIYLRDLDRCPVVLTDHVGFDHTISISFDIVQSSSQCPVRLPEQSTASIGFFSSGTTGPSKLVTTTYFQFVNALDCISREHIMPYIHKQNVLITLPLFHSYGLSAALEYTMGGSHLILPRVSDFLGSLRYLTKPGASGGITAIEGVPYFFRQVQLLPDRVKPANLKHIGMGGDRVSKDLIAALRRQLPGVSCSVRYGVTEIPSVIGLNYMTSEDSFEADIIGRMLPIYQLRSHQRESSPGLPEELLVECSFQENLKVCVATGDLFCKKDNQLYFESRQIFIKHRGYKINPVVIEALLEEYPQVHSAKVYLHGDRLSADLILSENFYDFKEIRKFLAERSPAYQVPEHWRQVEKIERTKSGKIKRNIIQ